MLPHPVIFVPGITASYLKDFYPLPPEVVWSVLKKQYSRVSLNPDDLALREPATGDNASGPGLRSGLRRAHRGATRGA